MSYTHMHVGMLLFGDNVLELHILRFGLIVSLVLPVLMSGVQMVDHLLSPKTKTSLGQFCDDLTHCFWLIGCFIQILVGPGTCSN